MQVVLIFVLKLKKNHWNKYIQFKSIKVCNTCTPIHKFVGLFWREGVFGRICLREGSPKPIFSKFTGGEGRVRIRPRTLQNRVCIHITLNVENQSTESIEQSCSIEVFLNCFDSKHYDKSTLVLLRAVTCRYLSFVRSNLQITDYCAP